MKIGIICQYFPPEVAPIGVMVEELSRDFSKKGHDVSVFTGFPNHPKGEIFEGFTSKILGTTENHCDGVKIHRAWSYLTKSKSLVQRAFNYITFTLATIFTVLFHRKDVYLVISQPFSNVMLCVLLKLLRRPYVLVVQDIYPDAAITLEIISNPILIKVLYRLEYIFYKFASKVIVISEGFSENLVRKGVPREKIVIIPNWIDLDEIRFVESNNKFSEKYDLKNQFTVLYSGTIGLASGAEVVYEMAKLLSHESEITVMMVGDGVVKQDIEKNAQAENIQNIQFAPFQPRQILPQILSSASVGLVTLLPGHAGNSVPSKILGYMAVGCPVIASADKGSDTYNFVMESGCGLCVKAGDAIALAEAVWTLKNNSELATTLGKQGRIYLEQYLSRDYVTGIYEGLVRDIR